MAEMFPTPAQTWEEVSDEHGYILDETVPRDIVYDRATFRRWTLSLGIAEKMLGGEVAQDTTECQALARVIFDSPYATDLKKNPGGKQPVEEANLRGAARRAIKRLSDGTFAPKGYGRVLTARQESLPEPPQSPGVRIPERDKRGWIPAKLRTSKEKSAIRQLGLDEKIYKLEADALDGGEIYTMGGCETLACALRSLRPDFKLAAMYDHMPEGKRLAHVVAYNPQTGIAYDAHGARPLEDAFDLYVDEKPRYEQTVDMDVDPEVLANDPDLETAGYNEEGPWTLNNPWGNMEVWSAGEWAHQVGLAGLEMPEDGYWDALPDAPQSPGTPSRRERVDALIQQYGLDKMAVASDKTYSVLGDGVSSTVQKFAPGADETSSDHIDYLPERQALHQSIRDGLLKGKTPQRLPDGSFAEARAVFMAGGTGSGKSTWLRENGSLLELPPENTVHIDPDAIKEKIPEFKALVDAGDPYAAAAVHRESGDIADLVLKQAMRAGLHVILDGTGDSEPGDFTTVLRRVGETYVVDVVYVDRPVQDAIDDSVLRAEEGDKRFVAVPVARQIHQSVSANFADVAQLDVVRNLSVWRNGVKIAEKTPDDPEIQVENADEFNNFLLKANG